VTSVSHRLPQLEGTQHSHFFPKGDYAVKGRVLSSEIGVDRSTEIGLQNTRLKKQNQPFMQCPRRKNRKRKHLLAIGQGDAYYSW